ncbi:MAG TPA: helix-hairpin-helix domain-containing protein, partial [Vicinamibacterales bacterium]|nr:helix-hairpin-helix domain-containing protein [Vicinamibacterales bacterium]
MPGTRAAARVNREVAARLDEVAGILREQQANPFRVRAYAQAADTLRRLEQPVTEILDQDGVEGLDPGQGPLQPVVHPGLHRQAGARGGLVDQGQALGRGVGGQDPGPRRGQAQALAAGG